MKRKTVTTQLTYRRNGEMADTTDLKSVALNRVCWFKSSLRHHVMDMVLTNSKGSRLKTADSKVPSSQESKRQASKDVTRAVIGRECPVTSLVSSFLTWNFAGFLSGRKFLLLT